MVCSCLPASSRRAQSSGLDRQLSFPGNSPPSSCQRVSSFLVLGSQHMAGKSCPWIKGFQVGYVVQSLGT